MDLAQLRYLVTIADEGGFTQAARKLKLSQPSLSLAIKKLEDEVGQPLFDRLTRRVVPTQAGEHLLDTARRLLSELERSVSEVRELKGEVTGKLRVGAIPTIGPFVLPEVIDQFTRRYPEVELHITEHVTSRLMQMLESGELDVALTSAMPERPGIHMDLIGNEDLVTILSQQHALAGRSHINWAELENERFLVLGEEHCLAEQISWFCRKNKLAGRTVLEGAQLGTIAALVDRQLGVSLVPALMAAGNYPGCVFRPLSDPRPSRPLYLAWSILRYRPQSGRVFMEIAREIMHQMLNQSAVEKPTLS
jgi:LysR family hydrogen peroxide-inducible transcriptional activator